MPSKEIPVTVLHPQAEFIEVTDRHADALANGHSDVSLAHNAEYSPADRQPGDANLDEAVARFSQETPAAANEDTLTEQPSRSLVKKAGRVAGGLLVAGAVSVALMNSSGDADDKVSYQDDINKRAGLEKTDR